MEKIIWNIETYETGSREKVVDEFIKKQRPQAKIAAPKKAKF